MPSFFMSVIILTILFVLELLYFKIADRFNIIDKPNARSSHSKITIRGGGVIFPLAIILYALMNEFAYPYFIIGLLAISFISFLDDMLTLNNKIRLSIHLVAVLLLFLQWNLFSLDWYWLVFALIFVIATINSYNFMDGINGITGGYSLLTIATLYYINQELVHFTSSELLVFVALSLIVFNVFNFRKKAKCFAGDVGSVSIAFIIIFLIGQLILTSNNLFYVLLLLVYGIDTAFTVFFRKLRGENIFKAHRSHFYQYLSNHLALPHLLVTILYIVAQLLINTLLILLINQNQIFMILLFAVSTTLYLLLRFKLEGRRRLLSFYE